MKTIYFQDELNYETVRGLIGEVEKSEDNEIVLYFDCGGGTLPSGRVLIDYFNNRFKGDLRLIGTWQLCSEGFRVFHDIECPKTVVGPIMLLFHLPSIQVNTSGILESDSYARETFTGSKELQGETIEFYRELGLSKKAIKKIGGGGDVYISGKKVMKILEMVPGFISDPGSLPGF